MKILYHHRIASKDGQFVHVEELTRALTELGHEIVMVGPAAVQNQKLGYDSGWIAHMKRWVPRGAYELIEYLYGQIDYRRLVRAVRRHHPACIYERYNLFLPTGVRLKNRFGIPMLLEVNAPLWEERSRYNGIALQRLARRTEIDTWCGADYVLPVTEVLAGHVRRAGVPDSRIVVIPNGVNPAQFADLPDTEEAKRELGLHNKLVLGFTGFAREWHGLSRVVEFVARNKTAKGGEPHLLIVGDGPALPDLRALARRLGVEDQVSMTGVVERTAIGRYIGAFDIALQPAVVDYASPLKLFEYLHLGRAVVAPSKPNIREILTHERNALLFEPDDQGAFENALDRLCSDPTLRRELGIQARLLVKERGLTWENNARRVIDLFRSLGAEGDPNPRTREDNSRSPESRDSADTRPASKGDH